MPRPKTVKEKIFWEYAKLMSQQAFNKNDWGFVQSRYKQLLDGKIEMSSFTTDTRKMFSHEQICTYCDSTENLQWDHIVPTSRGGIDSIENMVMACPTCNTSKGNKHVVDWYGTKLPPLVMSKYLKLALQIHTGKNTLDIPCEKLRDLIA